MRTAAVSLLALALAACTAPPRPAPAPAPLPAVPAAPVATPPPPPLAQGQPVWTRDAGARLRGETSMATLPYVFMRLEVLRGDTTDLLVRCVHCPGAPEGWIAREGVVWQPADPATAQRGGLAEFALAIRDAAVRRDVPALRQVMTRDFVASLGPVDLGVLEALAEWEREGYRTLDRLPVLLDQGVASVAGTAVWAAPPAYAASTGYGGMRAGFLEGPGGWEWLFLVSGAQ